MSGNQTTPDLSLQLAPMCGPHICSQVGQDVVSVLKTVLLEACDRSGGQIGREEIANLTDELTKVPEFFSIYTQAYNSCMSSHKGKAANPVEAHNFARLVVYACCRGAIRSVFGSQISDSGPAWIKYFTYGLLDYLDRETCSRIVDKIFDRYRHLSFREGRNLSFSIIVDDDELATVIRTSMDYLREDPGRSSLGVRSINRFLTTSRRKGGPENALVCHSELVEFLQLVTRQTDETVPA